MKRILTVVLAVLVATALLGVLVYAVLSAAHVAAPAATTVHGLTSRRLWATSAAVLALVSVGLGGWALRSSGGQGGSPSVRKRARVALVAGLIAAINGGLNVAVAEGGPGSGNGVVGGAVAFVLGLVAMSFGGLAMARSRRNG